MPRTSISKPRRPDHPELHGIEVEPAGDLVAQELADDVLRPHDRLIFDPAETMDLGGLDAIPQREVDAEQEIGQDECVLGYRAFRTSVVERTNDVDVQVCTEVQVGVGAMARSTSSAPLGQPTVIGLLGDRAATSDIPACTSACSL
jgi:hypothetical protein